MTLRRSARVASSAADSSSANGLVVAVKYEKVVKPVAAPRKRKSKASIADPEHTNGATTKAASHDELTEVFQEADFAIPSLPATPVRKKRKTAKGESPIKPPPFTPTPSGVGIFTSSTELSHPLESLASLALRPASPHATNAPLSTPGGSHVVAYHSSPAKPEDPSPVKKCKAKELVPPDMGTLKPPTSNIDTLLKDAEAYLIKIDETGKLKPLIEKTKCKIFTPEGLREVVDPFTALSSSIMGQQVYAPSSANICLINMCLGLRPSCRIYSQKIHLLVPMPSILPNPFSCPHQRHSHAAHSRSFAAQSRVHYRTCREI
jgi:DNA-3-methyladenine glycosylase II